MPDAGSVRRAVAGRPPWLQSFVCTAAFLVVYVTAVLWGPGQWFDAKVLGWVQVLGVGPVASWLPFLARRVLPVALATVVFLASVGALADRRWRSVVTAVLVAVLPVLLSPVLRDHVLRRPNHGEGYGYTYNTFPSTHVVVVGSLIAALWIVLESHPAWFGWLVVPVVLFAMAGNVMGHAHRPSDVVGSVLVVGAVHGLVNSWPPRSSRPRHGPRDCDPR